MTQQVVVVKEYASAGEYQRDARKMSARGYYVLHTNTVAKRGLINFLVFFWPRKNVTQVTYGLRSATVG